MTDASGSTAYTYERCGLVAVENHKIAGSAFTQSYTYDPNGNRATITYPDDCIVGFGYDYADRPYSAQHQTTLSAALRSAPGIARTVPVKRRRSAGANEGRAEVAAHPVQSGARIPLSLFRSPPLSGTTRGEIVPKTSVWPPAW